MSQSPTVDFSPRAISKYRQGWKALNLLIREDRSFSGHERNCAFLNLGGVRSDDSRKPHTTQNRFADVSAASGLDFADDGRAIAIVDWDFDGDLDLWTANRTAPRVRLLINRGTSGNHFLAVKLRGNGRETNRDAIGARVELILANAHQSKHIKTLHAGDGFVAQSSKWIHFGLGSEMKIASLVVHWPGGSKQEFTNLLADRRYLIDQDAGEPTVWRPPSDRKTLVAGKPQPLPSTDSARIVLVSRLLMPDLQTAGTAVSLNRTITSPTLINLWSTTCGPCIKELAEWSRDADRLQRAGLDIIAVNLDHLDDESDSATAILNRIDFPFRAVNGTTSLVRSLNVFQRAMLDRRKPLPVPASFLIDSSGRVAVIYKGRVSTDQLIDDLPLLDLAPAELRNHAAPFSGRWAAGPSQNHPRQITSEFVNSAMTSLGINYLERYAQLLASSASGSKNEAAGDLYYVLAVLLGDQKQPDRAQVAFRQALRYLPDDFRIRDAFADLLSQQGQFKQAIEQLKQALRINPGNVTIRRRLALLWMQQKDYRQAIRMFSSLLSEQPNDVSSRYNLANAYRTIGEYEQAADSYRQTLKLAPKMSLAANNLAWMLATHPHDGLRDGSEALVLAQDICEQMHHRRADFLGTLAAAYAEMGQFDRAVTTATDALALLSDREETDHYRAIQSQLTMYKKRRPYRDPSFQ